MKPAAADADDAVAKAADGALSVSAAVTATDAAPRTRRRLAQGFRGTFMRDDSAGAAVLCKAKCSAKLNRLATDLQPMRTKAARASRFEGRRVAYSCLLLLLTHTTV
jgi:hypothetical protein